MVASMMDEDKRSAFITQNSKLVHAMAKRFSGRGIAYDDLYQAGCVGLIKACDRFDESRGLMFSTYAVPVILGEIRRLFRDGGAMRVSRGLKELSLKAARAREVFTAQNDREPTISELAALLNVEPSRAAMALEATQAPLSLTMGDEEDGEELAVPTLCPQEALVDRLALRQVLDRLPPEDRTLIFLRYFRSQTQVQTAEKLGLTQVQVSRREKRILQDLRRLLAG